MNQLNHVAIIMDGNGRWGLKKKKSRNFGHINGLNAVEKVIKSSIKMTEFYTASTNGIFVSADPQFVQLWLLHSPRRDCLRH